MLHYVRILWCLIHEQKSCFPWSKLTCWLQQIISQMWHSSFLLRSPRNKPAQQRPFREYMATEVCPTKSGYLVVFTETNTTTEIDSTLMNPKFTWQIKWNWLISLSSRTGASNTRKTDHTKICREPNMSFSSWRTIPSWNAFCKRSSLAQ